MHKEYKENRSSLSMHKRGQVAIFIILALVIIGVIIAVFFLVPQTTDLFISEEINPFGFLQDCIEPTIKETVKEISKHGGYSVPDNYLFYQGNQVQYLCYTTQDLEPCKVQQPLLLKHFEEEVIRSVRPKAQECYQNLKVAYEEQGFDVSTGTGNIDIRFIPSSIITDFKIPMTVTKESSQQFNKFSINVRSEMYDLIMTATSIIQFESTLGDSETLLYMQYYPDLKIEKFRDSGDTIYKLSNVITEEEFIFASRSLVWPQGYGLT